MKKKTSICFLQFFFTATVASLTNMHDAKTLIMKPIIPLHMLIEIVWYITIYNCNVLPVRHMHP